MLLRTTTAGASSRFPRRRRRPVDVVVRDVLEMMMRSSSRCNIRRHDGVCVCVCVCNNNNNSNAREREGKKKKKKLAVRGLKTTTSTNNHTRKENLRARGNEEKTREASLSPL